MRYAVVACSSCKAPWLVELRHTRATCPRCQHSVELRRRTRLWQGDDMAHAQEAVALHRAAMAQGTTLAAAQATLQPDRKVPRHDDPRHAAAAQARSITNKSERADTIALWLTRLQGDAGHDDYIEAMAHAGIDAERAEKEVVRMLATDVIFEPRAGQYRALDD